jgi:hypothetical protein
MLPNKAEQADRTGLAGCLFIIALLCLPVGAWVQWGFGSFLVTLGFVALVGAALSKLK